MCHSESPIRKIIIGDVEKASFLRYLVTAKDFYKMFERLNLKHPSFRSYQLIDLVCRLVV